MDTKGMLGDLMKQAQKMQERLQRLQEELASLEVTGEAGAGMVKVVMTGRHEVQRVAIDPALLEQDQGMLEDLVAAAVNDAVRRVEQAGKERMAGMAAQLGLPPGVKFPC